MRDIEGPELGLPRNFLRPFLLLLIAEKPAYGYDLLDRLTCVGYRHIDQGWLYRTLRTMEQECLVCSAWEPSDTGPPRRRYTVTAGGLTWLDTCAPTVRDLRCVADRFLTRYESVANGHADRTDGSQSRFGEPIENVSG